MVKIVKKLLSSNLFIYSIVRSFYHRMRYLTFGLLPRQKNIVMKTLSKSKPQYDLDRIIINKHIIFKESEVANAFYYCSGKQELYQLFMWLDVLKKLRIPFFVCVRKVEVYKALTSKGIRSILVPDLKDLNVISGLGVKRVFYVNNAALNTHMIRYNELTHIQLLHGDSDKPASFNPMSQMYDLLYVAGEAAIDRYYNNGVYIPKRKFVITGRPQLAILDNIRIGKPSSNNWPQVILVCTTWKGNQESSNYSCIDMASEVIGSSLKAGYSVIFRPHPRSFSDKLDRAHISIIEELFENYKFADDQYGLISSDVNKDAIFSVYEYVVSLADIMISDLSSVAHDWVYYSKPLVMMKSDRIDFDVYNQSSIFSSSDVSCYEKGGDLTSLIEKEYVGIEENSKKRRNYLLGLDDGDMADDKFKAAMRWVETSYDKPQSILDCIENDKG